ncbi:hypothetical protein ACTJI8_12735 [Microbacterium sp. 22303]|uniref:hypothetical protein n=1 Tax=Microbacterium sp. 22303 TaxID=3453905 RepID=UPI003F87F199
MDHLIDEIRRALEAKLYVVGLQSTLALVDICAALSTESGETSAKTFRAWYDEHILPAFPRLTAADAYKIRCGILHQGRVKMSTFEAIVFTFPTSDDWTFHNNVMGKTLNFDIQHFCTEILDLVSAWWELNRNHQPVSENATHILQLRPNGLTPYTSGRPVLA